MAVEFQEKEQYRLEDLLQIMRILRGEGGCPWDREQTHESIRRDLLEETYEVVEAIDNGDRELLKEELGDLLLQVVSHSAMEEEAGVFTFDDVADGICKKLIVRHPHVFAQGDAVTTNQVLDRWDEIKRAQKGQTTYTETLETVPKVFPSLMRAAKLQKRASKAGYGPIDPQAAAEDLAHRAQQFCVILAAGEDTAQAMGELLLAAANTARLARMEPEESLAAACDRFIAQFAAMEERANSRGADIKTCSTEQLDRLWDEAKK